MKMAKKKHPLDVPGFLKIPQKVRDRYWRDNPPRPVPVFKDKPKEVSPEVAKFEAEEAERQKARTKNRIAKMKSKKVADQIPDKFKVWDQRRGCFVDQRLFDQRIEARKKEALEELEDFKSGRARKPRPRTSRVMSMFEKETTMATSKKRTTKRKATTKKRKATGAVQARESMLDLYDKIKKEAEKKTVQELADKYGKSPSRIRAILTHY